MVAQAARFFVSTAQQYARHAANAPVSLVAVRRRAAQDAPGVAALAGMPLRVHTSHTREQAV